MQRAIDIITKGACLLIVLALAGCITPQGEAVKGFIIDKARDSSYETAVAAKEYLCKYARADALRRLLAHPLDRQAWTILCSPAPAPTLPPPAMVPDPTVTDPEA